MSVVNIDEVYKRVQIILSKNQDGYIGPSEFNRLASMANMDLFNHYYGNTNSYRPEKPLARIAYATTQSISEALKPFLKERVPMTVTLGVANVPVDKLHTVDIEHSYTVDTVNKTASLRRVEWNRLSSWLNSSIDTPTLEWPIYTEGSDTMHVYPSIITSTLITYLRTPISPRWNYTLVSGRPVYDAGSSVNFEFSEDESDNLIMRIVSLAGASLKDNDAISYSESSKKSE